MISREGAWINKASLTPPLLIEVSVPSQTNEPSCICVLGVSNWHFLWFFYWILEYFRQSSIFFSLYQTFPQMRRKARLQTKLGHQTMTTERLKISCKDLKF